MSSGRIVFGEVHTCPKCGRITTALFAVGVTMNGIFQGQRVCVSCVARQVSRPWHDLIAAAGFVPDTPDEDPALWSTLPPPS